LSAFTKSWTPALGEIVSTRFPAINVLIFIMPPLVDLMA
jgi:hypothetical protein